MRIDLNWRAAAALLSCSAAVAVAAGPATAGGPWQGNTPAPRVLVLALDGVPYRVVERARAMGAFAGWPATGRIVAPFPSLTNVSFTAMLEPFGVGASEGYEVQHFDVARNRVVGGTPFGYEDRVFAWTQAFDVQSHTVAAKLMTYTFPRHMARKELAAIERALLDEPACDLLLAYVGSTDSLQHLRGDEVTARFLVDLSEWVTALARRHEERRGCPLHVVMLSDHGNTSGKVRAVGGFRELLRDAGLRVRDHLEGPDDVVAATFGMVSYGALFLDPSRAEVAARAVARHASVDLAAWRSAPGQVRVVARDGASTITWRAADSRRELAYRWEGADPLRLEAAHARMTARGAFDRDGFADAATWLAETADEQYPDAVARLVDALAGGDVSNRATVLFSLAAGHAWGWRSAQASSWLAGGRLEGTHGGLDREATLGFILSNDPRFQGGTTTRARTALVALAPSWERAAACHRQRTMELAAGARTPLPPARGAQSAAGARR